MILFDIKDGVGKITLNRPEKFHSIIRELALEFQNSLDKCINDGNVRAVLITAKGKAFCAGQDLEEATKKDGPPIDAIIDHTYNPITKAITNINKPVVCCVNGVAAGAGANLAIACDITFAAKSSKFIQSFINIALVPDTGGSYFLPRLIGKQKAAGLMFSGDKISAEDAEKIGMIYQCVEDDNAYETAFNFANKLSKMPTKSIGLIKDLLRKTYNNNLDQQLELEKQHQVIAANSIDNKEGITAFFEKRKPNYKGE